MTDPFPLLNALITTICSDARRAKVCKRPVVIGGSWQWTSVFTRGLHCKLPIWFHATNIWSHYMSHFWGGEESRTCNSAINFYSRRPGILLCFGLGLGFDIWFWWRESDCLRLASNMIGYTYHKYTACTGSGTWKWGKYIMHHYKFISKVGCWKHQWKTLTSTTHVQHMGELPYLKPTPSVHYIFTNHIHSVFPLSTYL